MGKDNQKPQTETSPDCEPQVKNTQAVKTIAGLPPNQGNQRNSGKFRYNQEKSGGND